MNDLQSFALANLIGIAANMISYIVRFVKRKNPISSSPNNSEITIPSE